MKKTLSILLAILTTLTLIVAFAGCDGKTPDPTEPDATTEDVSLTAEPDTTPVAAEPSETTEDPASTEPTEDTSATETTVENTEATTEGTTKPGDTTAVTTTTKAPAADPYAPPANLNTMSKADKLAYYNKVANRVREAKPGFKKEELLYLGDIKLSGFAAIANPIIKPIKARLMPGEWKYETIAKGTKNPGKFLSDNANASDLKAADITDITATKSGDKWVITVKLVTESNPAKGTGSAHARTLCISSREEVLKSITDINDAISADVKNTTLKYHDGYVTITVNAKGQVTDSKCGFKVDAQANDVSVAGIKTNVTAPQETTVICKDFTW